MTKMLTVLASSACSLMLVLTAPAFAQGTGGSVSGAATTFVPGGFGQTVQGANSALRTFGCDPGSDTCDGLANPFDEFSGEEFYFAPGVGSLFGQRTFPTDPTRPNGN